jgi:PhnB protein
MIFLADEFPGMGCSKSPQTLGGTGIILNLYSENVDHLFNRAVSAGATVIMPLANQFWGDRYGQLQDPFGHVWALGQHPSGLLSLTTHVSSNILGNILQREILCKIRFHADVL